MSKKKKNRSKPAPRASNPLPNPTAGESRQSVAVTVAWMLGLLVTLAAEAVAIPTLIISQVNSEPLGEGLTSALIADLFLFLSLVTGLATACLVPLVYRVRAVSPPLAIVVAALVAGAIPPIIMVLRWLL